MALCRLPAIDSQCNVVVGSGNRALRSSARRGGRMMSTNRCNGGGVCTVVMPKAESRMVNGGSGGYVNRCEQALDDKNEMVMATSKVTGGGDQIVASATNNGICPPTDSSKLVSLKEYTYTNIMMIDEFEAEIKLRDNKINQLTKEVNYVITCFNIY